MFNYFNAGILCAIVPFCDQILQMPHCPQQDIFFVVLGREKWQKQEKMQIPFSISLMFDFVLHNKIANSW